MDGRNSLFTLWFLVLNGVAYPQDNNETSIMKQQFKQLQEVVRDLQKHILAQEQKQTAVLSSVLSQLTETKEEVAHLQFNYTVLENKLSSLKDNSTAVDGAGGTIGQEVAFEASMAKKDEHNKNIMFKANEALIFPTVQYNKGGCWNSSCDVFIAAVNGTYQFWVDITFTDEKDITLSMKRNDEDFGQTHGSQHNPNFRTTISLTSLTHLVEGDRVYFVVDKRVTYKPADSSCGGVLLHADVQ